MLSLGRLHLITDTRPGRDPLAVVRAAVQAVTDRAGTVPAPADRTGTARTLPGAAASGRPVTTAGAELVVQIRVEDSTSDREAYDLALRIVDICAPSGVPCLVNDRLHVAVAVGAAGGHVGALDLPVAAARRVLGPVGVLGATAREPVAASAAVTAGASYLGVGPYRATDTKDGLPDPIGTAGVRAVAEAVPVPVIAIGGVTVADVPQLLAAGAYGVAVVGAVSGAADPARATTGLLAALGC